MANTYTVVIAADEKPTDEDIRRFDKDRKDKKVSNDEWKSKTDEEARISRSSWASSHSRSNSASRR